MPNYDQYEEEPEIPSCAIRGCDQPGEHKAPLSRNNLHEHQWLCLDHVREFNRNWNYFEGMDQDEIEAFMQDALTGHRPTWQREDAIGKKSVHWGEKLNESLSRFFHWDEASIRKAAMSKLPDKERRALTTLDLSNRCTVAELKTHYRGLVKQHHPDLHRGDKDQEEKFKRITSAYSYLLKLYQSHEA